MAKAANPEITTAQVVDDFKLINGIGPAVEKHLHDVGITSYAQLATLKPKALAKILDGMVGYSVERIVERDFIGQAKKLADETGQVPVTLAEKPKNNSLHYASYTVELLLDTENNVRRTRAIHVQSRTESNWAGWDHEKLRAFLVDSGQLKDVPMSAEPPFAEEIPKTSTPRSTKASTTQVTSEPEMRLTGSARVTETHLQSIEGQPLGILIPSDQPFVVSMELDLSQLKVPKDERLSFDANIYMRSVGNGKNELTGNLEGSLPPSELAVININSEPLAPGDYRLEAVVAMRPQSQRKLLKHQLMAISEGMRIHAF